MSRLRIVNKGPVTDPTVELDGANIAPALRRIRLEFEVGNVVTAELDAVVIDTTEVDAEVRAWIPPASRDLLLALGWTPPPGEAAGA